MNTVFDIFDMTRRGNRIQVYKLQRDAQAAIQPCRLMFKMKNLKSGVHIFLSCFLASLASANKIRYRDSYKQGYIIATKLIPANFENDKIQAGDGKF